MADENQQKLRTLFADPAKLFVIKILAVYVVWKVAHYFLLKMQWWADLMVSIGTLYASLTNSLMNMFGQHTYAHGISVTYLDGLQRTILVQEHCLALPAMIIFISSIALFDGTPKNKAWFIPLGLFAIILINTVRLIFVAYAFEYYPDKFFQINHSLIYVVITYTFIFLMIVWWMNSFNRKAVYSTN